LGTLLVSISQRIQSIYFSSMPKKIEVDKEAAGKIKKEKAAARVRDKDKGDEGQGRRGRARADTV
jgi:hypothetical protein